MTEQEAEAMAARLTRVWKVKFYFVVEPVKDVMAAFYAPLWAGVEIHVSFKQGSFPTLWLCTMTSEEPFLCCDGAHGVQTSDIGNYDTLPEHLSQHQSQWLSVFRRGCWLSGCPIEASAHEKAEWMQGFSREEIETWNLKM